MPNVEVIPLLKGFQRSSGAQTNQTQKYLIIGADNEIDSDGALMAAIDIYVTALNGFVLPLNQITTEQLGEYVFQSTVTWGTDQNRNAQASVLTFDTSGGTQKITNSIQTTGVYPAPGVTAPNFNGAIGVTKDGVEGVEVPVPVFKWTEKHFLPAATVTPQFLIGLSLCTGRTNDVPFRGFAVDQVKFGGITGSETGTNWFEATFNFEAGPHLTNITIGNITGITKKAWDYLWVYYRDSVSSGFLVKTPVAIYVEQVLWQGSFGTLGIGTGPTMS